MFDIGKFSRVTASAVEGQLPLHFSMIDAKQMLAVFNEFCDGVESGKIVMQKIETGGVALKDDYTLRHVTLTFAERVDDGSGQPYVPTITVLSQVADIARGALDDAQHTGAYGSLERIIELCGGDHE